MEEHVSPDQTELHWRRETATRAGLIVDAGAYFEASRKAMLKARRRIMLTDGKTAAPAGRLTDDLRMVAFDNSGGHYRRLWPLRVDVHPLPGRLPMIPDVFKGREIEIVSDVGRMEEVVTARVKG